MLFSSFDGQLQSHFKFFFGNDFEFTLLPLKTHFQSPLYIDMLSNYPGSNSDHLACFWIKCQTLTPFSKNKRKSLKKHLSRWWLNPQFKNYAGQIRSFSQKSGMKIHLKKKHLKPTTYCRTYFSIHWWCTQINPTKFAVRLSKTLCCPRSVRMSSFRAASSPHHPAHLPPETHPSEDLERETTTQPTGGPPTGFTHRVWVFREKMRCISSIYGVYILYYIYIYICMYNLYLVTFQTHRFRHFPEKNSFLLTSKTFRSKT